MGRASIGVSLPSGAEKALKAHKSKIKQQSGVGAKPLHCFFYPIAQRNPAKSVAILRQDKLSATFVGDDALGVPFGGVKP